MVGGLFIIIICLVGIVMSVEVGSFRLVFIFFFFFGEKWGGGGILM